MSIPSSTNLAVQIRDLRFRWSPRSPLALDIAAIDVVAGEAVFLAGPSGSGKTTLLSVLGGIVRPQSGNAVVLGQDLMALSPKERDRVRADSIGVVFQLFNLLPYLSLIENVTLPCRFSSARHTRTAPLGGPEAAALALLDGLGFRDPDILKRPVSALSVGQQQRVAIARALIGDPGLVIADEPTSALDAETRDVFLSVLREACARSGAALIFVSHDASLMGHFDRSLDMATLNKAMPHKTAESA